MLIIDTKPVQDIHSCARSFNVFRQLEYLTSLARLIHSRQNRMKATCHEQTMGKVVKLQPFTSRDKFHAELEGIREVHAIDQVRKTRCLSYYASLIRSSVREEALSLRVVTYQTD